MLADRIGRFAEDYNSEVDRFKRAGGELTLMTSFATRRLSGSGTLKKDLRRGEYAEFDEHKLRIACTVR